MEIGVDMEKTHILRRKGMIITQDSVISVLNSLIEICRDGENGYRAAANRVQDMDLRSRLQNHSREKSQFASELRRELRGIGGDPEDSGREFAALYHRGWINEKPAELFGDDDEAILYECERGEEEAKKAYEEALKRGLIGDTYFLVEQQYARTKETQDRMKSMVATLENFLGREP